MATISRANLYHVPNRQWMKWSPQARGVFNLMYSTVRSNQGLFIHPKATKHTREQWGTVAWNVAWTAASAANGELPGDAVVDCNAAGVPDVPRKVTPLRQVNPSPVVG
jgi:hypothetical protein